MVGHGSHAHVAINPCDAMCGSEWPPAAFGAFGFARNLVAETAFGNLGVGGGQEAERNSKKELNRCLGAHSEQDVDSNRSRFLSSRDLPAGARW
jgi:hypothetical protein